MRRTDIEALEKIAFERELTKEDLESVFDINDPMNCKEIFLLYARQNAWQKRAADLVDIKPEAITAQLFEDYAKYYAQDALLLGRLEKAAEMIPTKQESMMRLAC